MTIFQALILGIVQGITEFLPISSSGHLVLFPTLFGWQIPQEQIFPFDVLVQLGTLVAVIVYFWKDLWKIIIAFLQGILNKKPFVSIESKIGWFLIIATIPAMIAGFLIKDLVENAFNSPLATSIFLFGTAALLFFSESYGKQNRKLENMQWVDALVFGLFQMVSIFPGISRSGSSIAGGIFRNINRKDAARFSFLMSIPVMLGAGLLSIFDLLKIQNLNTFLPSMITGFLVAMVVGYISIHWLLKFLTNHSLKGFAIYCVFIGLVGVVFSIL